MQPSQTTFAVIGLGQVGIALASSLSARGPVIGIEQDPARAQFLLELQKTGRQSARFEINNRFAAAQGADFIFFALPTTLGPTNAPDLTILTQACGHIAPHLKPGATLVIESTVYPGATEELLIPTIERASGKLWKKDFFVAYSPERINPGDTEHTLQTIPKVLGADSEQTMERVAAIYESIIPAGVVRVSSIKVAEMTKVIENAQRDLNIGLMNELSLLCHGLDIDTQEVLAAASTKWNFLPFKPGLVGGECLTLASHLFAHRAAELGLNLGVTPAARDANEKMVGFVIDALAQELNSRSLALTAARIGVLGCTFKANVPTVSNSKPMELIAKMAAAGTTVFVTDPLVIEPPQLPNQARWCPEGSLEPSLDVMIFAVAHNAFLNRPLQRLLASLRDGALVMDLTGQLERAAVTEAGFSLWRL